MKTKERQYHPITAMPETIDERGLMVFPDIRRMPVYGEPFTTSYMTISLNLQGWVKAECDMRPVVFQPHDIAVLTPRHMLCPQASSDDYHAMLIVMSVAFQEEMKHRYPDIYRDNFHYVYRQDVPLSDVQFAVVHRLFLLLHDVSVTDGPDRWQMLGHLLSVLFLLLQDYRLQNGIGHHQPSPQEELFTRFHQAIDRHYHESREVRFYADLMHLTPKHFAAVIKQHTGVTASEWISRYVVMQAKMLLRHQQQMTIQEIAHQLGFPDQAAFSRYFKSNAGLSPSEFREKIL